MMDKGKEYKVHREEETDEKEREECRAAVKIPNRTRLLLVVLLDPLKFNSDRIRFDVIEVSAHGKNFISYSGREKKAGSEESGRIRKEKGMDGNK